MLMPISAHSDLLAINMFPALIRNGVFDVYSYIQNSNNPNIYYYHPIVYFCVGAFQYGYTIFSSTFLSWIYDLRHLYLNGITTRSTDYFLFVNDVHLFKDLFIIKIPYLVFDVLSLIIINQFIQYKLISRGNVILWVFNPLIIYVAYIFGQFDVIPGFFVLFGYLLLYKKKLMGSSLMFGVAGAFKIYAFILFLPVVLIYAKNKKSLCLMLLVSSLPFIVFLIPSLVSNPKLALYASTMGNLALYNRETYGWEHFSSLIKMTIFAISYLIILISSLVLKVQNKWKFALGINLITLLMFYTFFYRAHFQYLLWASPLIILWFKQAKISSYIIILLTLSFASYKILSNQLQAGLFAPINPEYFSNLPTFNEIINRYFPYRIISTLGFMAFSLLSLVIITSIVFRIIFQEEIYLTGKEKSRS